MSERKLPILTGSNVALRPPQIEDAATRLQLGRHAEIVRMYGGESSNVPPMTIAQANNWVQGLIEHEYAWVIEAGTLIGQIRLDRVNLQDRNASLSVGIENPVFLSRGLGTEAIALVQTYAFRELNLHRISLRVLAYNHRAIRAYEKCGFQTEGRERESAFVDGQWHDDLIMGILAHEFLAQ
jgi:RimJ/RimL family protein N-acetyltransferase